MNIRLAKVDKPNNSTMRPTSWTDTTCSLKTMSEINNPYLEFSNVTDVYSFNYVYIPTFKRYYFINSWGYENGLWVANCNIDVLATWRATIGASTQYVLRSGVAGDVIDPMVTLMPKDHHTITTVNNIFMGYDATLLGYGTFFVTVAGCYDTVTAIPGNNVYIMDQGTFNAFAREISSDDFSGLSIPECSANLTKALINPFQYVISVRYVPINYTSFKDSLPPVTLSADRVNIRYGWFNLNVDILSKTRLHNTFLHTNIFKIISSNSSFNFFAFFVMYFFELFKRFFIFFR